MCEEKLTGSKYSAVFIARANNVSIQN